MGFSFRIQQTHTSRYRSDSKYLVLSVEFDREGNSLATIASEPENKCFRLPEQLSEWAMTVIGMANMGENLFPSDVVFSRINDRYYVDIL